MTTTLVPKHTLVGTGFAEMCENGRRYRFKVERWRHDDGSEWGRIVEREEIPDVGLQLWIPSYGNGSPEEAQYLMDEAMHEKKNPHPLDVEFLAEHREKAWQRMALYNELRDERARLLNRNHRTKGGFIRSFLGIGRR